MGTAFSGSSLGCQKVWAGPSVDNDLTSCLVSSKQLTLLWEKPKPSFTALAAFTLALGVVGALLVCVAVLGRYTCGLCGSARRRPTACCCGGKEADTMPKEEVDELYSYRGVRNTKCAAFTLALLSLGPLLMLFRGASWAMGGLADFLKALQGSVQSVKADGLWVETLLTDNKTRELIAGVPATLPQAFSAGAARLERDLSQPTIADNQKIVEATAIAAVVAVVGTGALCLTAVFASFDIRRRLIVVNILVHVIFMPLFAVLALFFLLGASLSADLCNEAREFAGNPTAPGVLSWYTVPKCGAAHYFSAYRADLVKAQDAAVSGSLPPQQAMRLTKLSTMALQYADGHLSCNGLVRSVTSSLVSAGMCNRLRRGGLLAGCGAAVFTLLLLLGSVVLLLGQKRFFKRQFIDGLDGDASENSSVVGDEMESAMDLAAARSRSRSSGSNDGDNYYSKRGRKYRSTSPGSGRRSPSPAGSSRPRVRDPVAAV